MRGNDSIMAMARWLGKKNAPPSQGGAAKDGEKARINVRR